MLGYLIRKLGFPFLSKISFLKLKALQKCTNPPARHQYPLPRRFHFLDVCTAEVARIRISGKTLDWSDCNFFQTFLNQIWISSGEFFQGVEAKSTGINSRVVLANRLNIVLLLVI